MAASDHEYALQVFRRIEALHENRNPRGVRTLFSEQVLVEDDGGTQTVHGWVEMESLLSSVWRAFPDFRVSVIEGPYTLPDGRGFAVRGRLTGTMAGPLDPPGFAASGRALAAEFGGFYKLDGQSVSAARIIIDTTDLARQLGFLPPAGGVAEQLAVWAQRLRVSLTRALKKRSD
jgi:predicted ester cyclase